MIYFSCYNLFKRKVDHFIMGFIENIIEKAKSDKKTVVLSEATDKRILKAANMAIDAGTADIILVGNENEIKKVALENDIDISKAKIVDPEKSKKIDEYTKKYLELNKNATEDFEEAKKIVLDPLIFGMMMVKFEEADAYIAGATHSTKEVLQPTMKLFKTIGTRILSTVTMIEYKHKDFGNKDGLFYISDCALNSEPGYLALAEIAKATANSCRGFSGQDPKVAFLSFSTHGSASTKSTEKVAKAAERLRKIAPNLTSDGELQMDAAIMPEVAKMKAPNSPLKGEANVLIFPDINAGNISYKIFERFSNVKLYGPVCQGLEKAITDLSRACSVERVFDTIALTVVQAQALEKGDIN